MFKNHRGVFLKDEAFEKLTSKCKPCETLRLGFCNLFFGNLCKETTLQRNEATNQQTNKQAKKSNKKATNKQSNKETKKSNKKPTNKTNKQKHQQLSPLDLKAPNLLGAARFVSAAWTLRSVARIPLTHLRSRRVRLKVLVFLCFFFFSQELLFEATPKIFSSFASRGGDFLF